MRHVGLMMGLMFIVGWVHAQDDVLTPEDFSWGMTLTALEDRAFYRLPLPQSVCQGVTRNDLGDLRVFNAAGLVVPYDLSLPSFYKTTTSPRRSVKLFPLYGKQTTSIQNLSMQITQQVEKGRLSLITQQKVRSQGDVLHGHLIQLWNEAKPHKANALQLEWTASPKGLVYKLKVELSNDLVKWRVHSVNAVVADLRYKGESLQQDIISLGGTSARYVRLMPMAGTEVMALTKVWMTPVSQKKAIKPELVSITNITQGDESGEYLFELPGFLPGIRLDVQPKERNTFAQVVLYSRPNPDMKWTRRATGKIYNLISDGAQLQQTSLSLQGETDRYWKLVADNTGGGFGSKIPQLDWAWIPYELLFSARGSGPFLLAYGSASVTSGESRGLKAFSRDQGGNHISEKIAYGKAHTLGGKDVLVKHFAVNWKRWILWAVLILASLLLAGMAWSVSQKMRQTNN